MFDIGAFTSGLLTGLREGVEAALIVSIICAYLARTGHRSQFPRVFLGAGLAAALSAVLGVGLYVTVGNQTLFDLSGVLPHDPEGGNVVGQFLHVVFGYTATPEVTTFVAWFAYVTIVLALFLRPVRRVPPAGVPVAARS